MAEPTPDDIDVDPRFQEMHRGCVAEDVGRNGALILLGRNMGCMTPDELVGVIVDSSRKSTLSDVNTLRGWTILFDGRSGEHCLNCALEVAAAVDGPYVVERGRFVGCIDHRVGRVC